MGKHEKYLDYSKALRFGLVLAQLNVAYKTRQLGDVVLVTYTCKNTLDNVIDALSKKI